MAPTSTRYAVILVGLLALAGVSYAAALDHPFVYEDQNWIVAAGSPGQWRIPGRALTMATLRPVAQDPRFAHAGNLILHLTNGVLVYGLASTLVTPLAGVCAAWMFLFHPLNSEAVNYVTARGDLLVTLFVLVAAWLALGASWWRWILASVALIAAAASKEIGLVGIPLMLLTLIVWRRAAMTTLAHRLALLWIALGLVIGVSLTAVTNWIALSPSAGGHWFTWAEFAQLQLAATWRILALLVWPVGFTIDHDIIGLDLHWFLVAPLLTLLVVAVALWAWRRAPLVVWGIGWVVVALAPRFVFQTNEFLHEYQTYLAMAGISLVVGAGVARLWAWRPRPSPLWTFLAEVSRYERDIGLLKRT